MHKEGWHCTHWHSGEHQNKLSYIWRLPVSPLLRWGLCISLLVLVMTSVFALPAHSYGVSTAKWKRISRSTDVRGCPFSSGVTWQPLRELGMLLLPGDADALWFRAQEETGRWEEELESQHPCPYTDQASDVPRGHNCTLAWGSRTYFLLLLKAPFWTWKGSNVE